MNDFDSTVIERPKLTFSIEGLPVKEELVFKSLLRLLDNQCHHQWNYRPATPISHINLLVVAEGVAPTYCTRPGQLQQQVLQLSKTGANGRSCLAWPFKPEALVAELNRLGDLAPAHWEAPDIAPSFAAASPHPAKEPDQQPALMRLTQWPPSRLLNGTGRMRLATLLTGKAMCLDELVTRSALPLLTCEAFVNELLQANLLVVSHTAPQPQLRPQPQQRDLLLQRQIEDTKKVKQKGLFHRIRVRLGLEISSSVSERSRA